MPPFSLSEIRRYYDRHTPAFVRFGQGGQFGAIHRAVWAPETITRSKAFRYVEDRIADHIHRFGLNTKTTHLVDLGCGVGSSLVYLAEQLNVRGTGITLSSLQAKLAETRIREAGFSQRLRCIEGDYCRLPHDVAVADLAYAIESFVHGPSPRAFFEQCRRLLRADGWLVICDDFRRPMSTRLGFETIERFCRGWHINALLQPAELVALAHEAGFAHHSTHDLTPFIEITRPRDRIIDALAKILVALPPMEARYDHLVGGSALQRCLREGWIGYDLAFFRRLG